MKRFKSFSTSKKVITIILIILAILVGYKILDATCYPFVRTKAEIYLCMKYDADKSDFELVDYQKAHVYWDEYKIFLLKPEWVDFSFEYKYNDRTFFVNRYKGKFYDDYQLEDLEKWCTEWLQKNVDEEINGIKLSTIMSFRYYENSGISRLTVISKKNVKEFLDIYFKSSDIEYLKMLYISDPKKENIDNINIKLMSVFNFSEDIYISYTTELGFENYKYDDNEWFRIIES